ncbi:GABA-specific high-affinity permease [Scheffersomyces spartinae]|uniref:GABA-specific high-affinity permease n=1 Tax=Scheffersomyces spartinae TaxID=45513 RepID=A0A9P8AH08_9ASCO|nr:GABA-specific high-affinity permease [Scheffersomyces spartinae]KAG7192326.1 GABA-specific high-affinity permease [Scheffersomyces spartinae]
MTKVLSPVSSAVQAISSRTDQYFHNVTSNKSVVRSVDHNVGSEEALLAEIGYKQELKRHYNTLETFGIAFSIMGLLPSISSTVAGGLECGPGGLVWGWLFSGFFVLLIGISMTMLASSLPTSGGLYYWTNFYCPDKYRVPLSFVIGISNSLALCGGLCSISYGFAAEVLAAVSVNNDGAFSITQGKLYGVFAACVICACALCCITTKHGSYLQTLSIFVNSFIIILFFIAVPIGASKHGFNDRGFIFGDLTNVRTWPKGWSWMLSMMPAIWTIGGFDSVVHMSEELKSKKSIPWGILGSISVCWIVGWCICVVIVACIKGGDIAAVLESATGSPMAQVIYDALGKKWCVAFMSLISLGQFLMACSIALAASRQIWAFARDDGTPFIYRIIKYVDPRVKVPINATIFAAALSCFIGLLILINTTAANALFSLAVAGNYLAWGMPVFLVLLPYGKQKFVPGPFHFGPVVSTIINVLTVLWIVFIIVLCMFPDNKSVTKETMNYTVVINCGIWLLAVIYYFAYGYRIYSGPKSNLDTIDGESESNDNLDQILDEKA